MYGSHDMRHRFPWVDGLLTDPRDLGRHNNKGSDKKGAHISTEVEANFVELGQGSKTKKHNKGKGSKLEHKGGVSKKKKLLGRCFNCEKQGHKSSDCRLPKRNKHKEANVVDDISKVVSDIDLTTIIYEVKLVGSHMKEWGIETGATCHVCLDKKMFSTCELTENRENVFMGNSVSTSEIKGQGKVVLKMTFGKELTLTNVLYVLQIQKNLVSGSLLNNHGLRLVFESNKFVLSKSGMYVGKWYVSDCIYVEVECNDYNSVKHE